MLTHATRTSLLRTDLSIRSLPGPRSLPFVGNSFDIQRDGAHLTFRRWSEKYGPIYTFRLGRRRFVAISDLAIIHQVLQARPHQFRRYSATEQLFREVGIQGVISAEGEDWVRQRRITMHAFTKEQIARFFPELLGITDQLRQRWMRASLAEVDVDVQRDFQRYTVDVMTSFAFEYDMDTLNQKDDVIQRHLDKVLPIVSRRLRAPLPYWRWFKLPSDRALDRALLSIKDVVQDIVRKSKARMEQDIDTQPRNVLEALLAACHAENQTISEDELLGNIFTLLVAGEDTTANTMSWAIHFLSKYPELAARVREEVDPVLNGRVMIDDLDELKRFPLLEAVIFETMRLKPGAPIFFLEANEDVTLGNVAVPKGTAIALLSDVPARAPDNFSEAGEFRAERWLNNSSANCPIHNPHASLPFGIGPRFCIGKSLAMFEIKTAISMLVHNFTFVQVDGMPPVGERLRMTLAPTNLRLRVRSRAPSAGIEVEH